MKPLLFFPLAFLLFLSACSDPAPRKNPDAERYAGKTAPAIEKLGELRVAVAEAQANALLWASVAGPHEGKETLKQFVGFAYPAMRAELVQLEADSAFPADCRVSDALVSADRLIGQYQLLMTDMATIEAYNDPAVALPVRSSVLDADGDCSTAYRETRLALERAAINLRAYSETLCAPKAGRQ